MSSKNNLIANVYNLGLYSNFNDLLLWKRCIYMTFEQYKKGEHINNKIYSHYAITKNVKSYVTTHLKELAASLPFKKVPKPIYVSIAKHLEYDQDTSILPANCQQAYEDLENLDFDELKKAHENKLKTYKDYDISCFMDKDNKIVDKNSEEIKNKRFVYSQLKSPENIEYLKKSSLASYKFQGNYEIYIYVPNLSNDLKYFTSFYEFSSQNKWMDIMSNPRSNFLSIISFQKDYEQKIIKLVGETNYNKNKMFQKLVDNLNSQDEKEYPFAKDMAYICFSMGCSSQYGEDLVEIVPTVGTTYDEQLSNAQAKGPYFPTKCLKTNYYHKHMMDLTGNEKKKEYNKGIKEQLEKDISSFKENYEKIQKGETPSEEYSSDNIIDVIKGSAARFRNKKYTEGTSEDQYSKEYNRKILAELAFRHNSYPGVQEIVFPIFRINDEYKELIEYTHFMPWGNILLKQEYVLNDGDILKIDEVSFKSFNKIYQIKFDNDNKLSLFNNNTKIRTFIDKDMREYKKRTLVFQNGSINLYGYDKYGNNDNRFSLFVSKPNTIDPLSIIIENDGNISVYENGFNKINNL